MKEKKEFTKKAEQLQEEHEKKIMKYQNAISKIDEEINQAELDRTEAVAMVNTSMIIDQNRKISELTQTKAALETALESEKNRDLMSKEECVETISGIRSEGMEEITELRKEAYSKLEELYTLVNKAISISKVSNNDIQFVSRTIKSGGIAINKIPDIPFSVHELNLEYEREHQAIRRW